MGRVVDQDPMTRMGQMPSMTGRESSVPKEYKKTGAGVIPDNWSVSTVGAEFTIQLGKKLDVAMAVGKHSVFVLLENLQAPFARRRNLFTGMDLVFFDTTSHYFHGAGGAVLGQRGKSKDHRPQCRQVVVGLALDSEGRPLCTEIWPGNTADVTTLLPVADRGMVSRATREELEQRGWGYLLGCRMRTLKEFREQVLADGTADGVERLDEEVLKLERQGRREPLKLAVREVKVGPSGGGPGSQRRYVLCRNEEQARRDRAVREAILEQLRPQVRQGGQQLVGNRGYRRYLKSGQQAFELDEDKIRAEERYDGLWVVHVHGPLTAAEAAVKYKELWRVEGCFREAKSLLRTRPVYHRTDEAIRGHVLLLVLGAAAEGGAAAAHGAGRSEGGVGGCDARPQGSAGGRGADGREAVRAAHRGPTERGAGAALRGRQAAAGDPDAGAGGGRLRRSRRAAGGVGGRSATARCGCAPERPAARCAGLCLVGIKLRRIRNILRTSTSDLLHE